MALSSSITLALIAHDRYKEAIADFVLDHRSQLSRFRLLATQGTGSVISRRTGLPIEMLEPGAAGGDRQVGEMAAQNDVQAVIFFRDPVAPGPEEPTFAELLRVCDHEEIPVATNRATAEALLYFLQHSPDRGAVMARPWGLAHPVQEDELENATV